MYICHTTPVMQLEGLIGEKEGGPRPMPRPANVPLNPIELREMPSPIGVPIKNELMNNVHMTCDSGAPEASLSTSKHNSQKGRSRFRLCAMYTCNHCLHGPCGRWGHASRPLPLQYPIGMTMLLTGALLNVSLRPQDTLFPYRCIERRQLSETLKVTLQ